MNPRRARHHVEAEGNAPLPGGKGVDDQGGAIREEQGRANTLDEPEQDELRPGLGEAAQHGGEREDGEAEVVGSHPPLHVRQPCEGQQQGGDDQLEAQHNPHHIDDRGMERAGNVWQGDGEDGAIDRGHQDADRRVDEHDPFVFEQTLGWCGSSHVHDPLNLPAELPLYRAPVAPPCP